MKWLLSNDRDCAAGVHSHAERITITKALTHKCMEFQGMGTPALVVMGINSMLAIFALRELHKQLKPTNPKRVSPLEEDVMSYCLEKAERTNQALGGALFLAACQHS